jgi:hypothetical protein
VIVVVADTAPLRYLIQMNSPEPQVADNDYAVGLVIEKIAHSAYANSTLIFVIEDDSQNGGDHVDSHRSIAFIAGPYVKQNALVSTQYNTINFLRTMEWVLGLAPVHLTDAVAHPWRTYLTSGRHPGPTPRLLPRCCTTPAFRCR